MYFYSASPTDSTSTISYYKIYVSEGNREKYRLSRNCSFYSMGLCRDYIKQYLWTEYFWAWICKPFKEPSNRFPTWRSGTTTLFDVLARQAIRLADQFLEIESIPWNRFRTSLNVCRWALHSLPYIRRLTNTHDTTLPPSNVCLLIPNIHFILVTTWDDWQPHRPLPSSMACMLSQRNFFN